MTPSQEEYRTIPLTQGQSTAVDAGDYAWLSQWKWFAVRDPKMGGYYAGRTGKRSADGHRSMILMHRALLGITGHDSEVIDHIDGDTLNNARANLRAVNHSANGLNRRQNRNNRSGFRGVCLHRASGNYYASIAVNGVRQILGFRSCAEDAYRELWLPAAREAGAVEREIAE